MIALDCDQQFSLWREQARALLEDAGGGLALAADGAAWHVTMEVPDGQA